MFSWVIPRFLSQMVTAGLQFFSQIHAKNCKDTVFFRLKRQRIWPVHVFNFSNLWTHIDTMTNFNICIDNIQCTIPSENYNGWRHLLVPTRISYPWVELVSTFFFSWPVFLQIVFWRVRPFSSLFDNTVKSNWPGWGIGC